MCVSMHLQTGYGSSTVLNGWMSNRQRAIQMRAVRVRCGAYHDSEAPGRHHSCVGVWGEQRLEQFGGWLQPISPNRAEHAVTPKVDNSAGGIVKRQPYC